MKKILKHKTFLIILASCFLLSCMVSFVTCVILSPKIEVEEEKIVLLVGSDFEEPEYKAMVKNQDVTDMVKKKGKVDSSKLGTYLIEYDIQYSIFEDKKIVTVSVVDQEAPKIELTGGEDVKVCPGKKFVELGFQAKDNYDGDLTDKVTVHHRDKDIVYEVKDSSSNYTKVVRKLSYIDDEAPTIHLNGDSSVNLYVGDRYVEAGYQAVDNCDGDVSSSVEVSGSVDTSSSGSYTIHYQVKDSHDNVSSVDRVVKVVNPSLIRPQGGGSGKGIIYLTFDDGPNEGTTNVILDVLKSEGVTATFFVTCHGPDYLIQRMANEGHTVALHTATHDYSYVYSSEINYFADLQKVSNRVERITGQKSMIIRFPGGSSNTISKRYNVGIMTRLTSEVKKRGYHYFDWNVDSNDAAGASTSGVYSNVVQHISLGRENVVLMHDVKTTTRDAIRNIIRYGKENGYSFRKITYDTVMVTHGVNN